MFRISLELGKSSGYDVGVTPTNTALPAGQVAFFIGGTTGMNAGLALRALARVREELEGHIRRAPALTAYKISYNPVTDSTTGAAAATGTEATVSAIISLPAASAEGRRSVLVSAAFQQCYEVARELMNDGYITGIKP